MKLIDLEVVLRPLEENDHEQFIIDNQEAFRYGAMEEFGMRDDHFESDGEIISKETIENCLNHENAEAYRIIYGDRIVGGAVVLINKKTCRNSLDLFFISPKEHSKGIGYRAWQVIEKNYPETVVWETCTPYFETRNIHFYINKCGFHAVEFFNSRHVDVNCTDGCEQNSNPKYAGEDLMFRFEKVMKPISNDKVLMC